MARQIHEHAKRLRRGTGEGEGRISHGRHLRSRHDDPRVEPHHSVHHGSADSAAAGPRFHPRRGPRLRPQLRHGCRFLGRHHIAFYYVRRTDRTLIWLNNLLLLFVGLLPLTTALLGHHEIQQLTIAAYGFNLLAVQLSLYGSYWYATVHHHLVDADLDDALI